MNRNVWSNEELAAQRDRLNQEIMRRGSYRWWDPLCTPRVGQDKSSPLSLPAEGERIGVDDHTYAIEINSSNSIEPTRNARYPAQGLFPSGQEPEKRTAIPDTSAAQINMDEMKNALVGLAKIQDINLFYGRDEVKYLAFRDPQGIVDAIDAAEASELNHLLADSALSTTKNDPNNGYPDREHPAYPYGETPTEYPLENGRYVMPSGEVEGEEGPLSEENFFDDHGAPIGDGNFHPLNPAFTPAPNRDWDDQGHNRDQKPTKVRVGGTPSSSFGPNPRNPVQLESYPSRPVYGGVPGSCNVACTGLCYMTCDNQCSESCSTTCWNRCGDACTSSCANLCSGCSSQCYSSCKTKCENDTGYSCLKAGAKTVNIYSTGGSKGVAGENHLDVTVYTCTGCEYTCQFYPNKRTTCWDAACMGRCFTSCESSCSTSCFGGCIANDGEDGQGNYKLGHGQGCSDGCTLNCVGRCAGVCAGYCVQTCWHACKDTCADNCSWECITACGSGCESGCMNWCTDACTSESGATSCLGGCEASCRQGCNKNCVGIGCRSICGTESAGACEHNCRINCMAHSCTAMCSDACVSLCVTCVNTCGWQCGACTTNCSIGCGAACNVTCTGDCEHSCHVDCLNNCSETCGGCSNLCYSCVGMCIGTCSFHCELTCTNCTNMCGWWCDVQCSRDCMANCSQFCISTCSGSCATFLTSNTTHTAGPMRDPTSPEYIYQHPQNRWEERESFKIIGPRKPYVPMVKEYPIKIWVNDERNLCIDGPAYINHVLYETSIGGGVYNINNDGSISIRLGMLTPEVECNQPNVDGNNGIFIGIVNANARLNEDDFYFDLPVGFSGHLYAVRVNDENQIYEHVVVVERDQFLFPPNGGIE